MMMNRVLSARISSAIHKKLTYFRSIVRDRVIKLLIEFYVEYCRNGPEIDAAKTMYVIKFALDDMAKYYLMDISYSEVATAGNFMITEDELNRMINDYTFPEDIMWAKRNSYKLASKIMNQEAPKLEEILKQFKDFRICSMKREPCLIKENDFYEGNTFYLRKEKKEEEEENEMEIDKEDKASEINQNSNQFNQDSEEEDDLEEIEDFNRPHFITQPSRYQAFNQTIFKITKEAKENKYKIELPDFQDEEWNYVLNMFIQRNKYNNNIIEINDIDDLRLTSGFKAIISNFRPDPRCFENAISIREIKWRGKTKYLCTDARDANKVRKKKIKISLIKILNRLTKIYQSRDDTKWNELIFKYENVKPILKPLDYDCWLK